MVVVLLLGAVRAGAADAPVSPEAKRMVDAAVAHYGAGRYEEAVKAFEVAYRLSKRPALLFNIARAEAKLGHDEAAIAFLRRYLEERPDAPDAPAVLAQIEAHERALATAKTRADADQEAERAARALAEAQASRRRADDEAAAVSRRRAEEEAAAASRRDAELRRADGERRDAARKVRFRAGIGLTVGGAVLLVTGIALGVVASQASGDVARQRMVEFGDCCRDLEARGKLAAPIGITFDVIGGAAAAAGIGLLASSARKGSER
jgi:tetratricopeptide (TPR) repeat protein